MKKWKWKLIILTAAVASTWWPSYAKAQCEDIAADCASEPTNENNVRRENLGWKICNRTSAPMIHVAAGYKRRGLWRSRGWIAINRNQCVSILGVLESRNQYYRVRIGNEYIPRSRTDDDRGFCIRPYPESFRIRRRERSDCEEVDGQRWATFDHVKTPNRTYFELSITSEYGDISYR